MTRNRLPRGTLLEPEVPELESVRCIVAGYKARLYTRAEFANLESPVVYVAAVIEYCNERVNDVRTNYDRSGHRRQAERGQAFHHLSRDAKKA